MVEISASTTSAVSPGSVRRSIVTHARPDLQTPIPGLLLSRVMGTTFEDAVRQEVLLPLGMQRSTFLRAEVPEQLAASPHVGMPLSVPGDSYPYTRRHAPSSTLHSNLVELCRWMTAHLEPPDPPEGEQTPDGQQPRLDPGLRDLLWQPVLPVGRPPWEESMAGLRAPSLTIWLMTSLSSDD